MKHTPGPWKVEELLPDGRIIKWRGTYQIGTPEYDVATMVPHGAPIRKEADARLIAAAPELLEACIGFLKAERVANEHGIDSGKCHDALMEATGLARSAIAKATETDAP